MAGEHLERRLMDAIRDATTQGPLSLHVHVSPSDHSIVVEADEPLTDEVRNAVTRIEQLLTAEVFGSDL